MMMVFVCHVTLLVEAELSVRPIHVLTSCYPRKVLVGVQVLGHLLPQTLERPAEKESEFYVNTRAATRAAGSDGSLNRLIYKTKTSRSLSYKIHNLVLMTRVVLQSCLKTQ